jgi:hypothetical protein
MKLYILICIFISVFLFKFLLKSINLLLFIGIYIYQFILLNAHINFSIYSYFFINSKGNINNDYIFLLPKKKKTFIKQHSM